MLFNIIRQGDIPIYPVRSFNKDNPFNTKLEEPYNRIAICINLLLIAPDNDNNINFDKYLDKYNGSNPDKIKDFIYEITDDLNIDIIIFQNQLNSDKNTTLIWPPIRKNENKDNEQPFIILYQLLNSDGNIQFTEPVELLQLPVLEKNNRFIYN